MNSSTEVTRHALLSIHGTTSLLLRIKKSYSGFRIRASHKVDESSRRINRSAEPQADWVRRWSVSLACGFLARRIPKIYFYSWRCGRTRVDIIAVTQTLSREGPGGIIMAVVYVFQGRPKLPLGRGLTFGNGTVEVLGSGQGRSSVLLQSRASLWNRCNAKLTMRFMR